MAAFSDKFGKIQKNGNLYKTISKQLRKQGIKVKDNWEKDFMAVSYCSDESSPDSEIYVLILFNKKNKQFYSTVAMCHESDNFNPDIGLKICASRMAKHTDFVNTVKDTNFVGLMYKFDIPVTYTPNPMSILERLL